MALRRIQLCGLIALSSFIAACGLISGLDTLNVVDGGESCPDDPGCGSGAGSSSVIITTSSVSSSWVSADAGHTSRQSGSSSGSEVDAGLEDAARPIIEASAPIDVACIPLGVNPCPNGQNCVPDPNDPSSLFDPTLCVLIQGQGLDEGAPCNASSECASGLDCIGNADAGGFTCQWLCYDSVGAILSAPPFDSAELGTTPGRGGCPGFESCTGTVTGFAPWLSTCM
jgi:hypothetical protein